MIDDTELLAGLAFLRRYAHPDYVDSLNRAADACKAIGHQRWCEMVRKSPADNLELSVRAANAIQSLGCVTIGDVEKLVNGSEESTVRIAASRDFGKKSIKEIQALLKNLGLVAP